MTEGGGQQPEGEGQHCRVVYGEATGQHPGSNTSEILHPGPHRQSKDSTEGGREGAKSLEDHGGRPSASYETL